MYKLKEIADILKVSDRTVERYLKSYFSIENGAYMVSDKMLDVLKNEYLETELDTVVEEFTKDDYIEFHKRLVEYPILKDQLEYHRKSAESHNAQMEIILRTIEQKNFLEAKEKGFDQ
jgi:predicted transcriptional regulator